MQEPIPNAFILREVTEQEASANPRSPYSAVELVAVTLDDATTQDHPLRSLRVEQSDPHFDAVNALIVRIESALTAALRHTQKEIKTPQPTPYAQDLLNLSNTPTEQRVQDPRYVACMDIHSTLSSVLRLYIRELALLLGRTPDKLVETLSSAVVSGEHVYTAIHYMDMLEPFDFAQPDTGTIPLQNPLNTADETKKYWQEQLLARKAIGFENPTLPEIVALRSGRLQAELEALKGTNTDLGDAADVVVQYLNAIKPVSDMRSSEEFTRYCDELVLTRMGPNDLFVLLNACAEIKTHNPVFFSEMMGVVPDGNPNATEIKKSAFFGSPLHIAFARTYEHSKTPESLKVYITDLLAYDRQMTPLVYVDHVLIERQMKKMMSKAQQNTGEHSAAQPDPLALAVATLGSLGMLSQSYRMKQDLDQLLEATASMEHCRVVGRLSSAAPKEFERILKTIPEQLLQHPDVQQVIRERLTIKRPLISLHSKRIFLKKELVFRSDDGFYLPYTILEARELWKTIPDSALLESREWAEDLRDIAHTCAKKSAKIEHLKNKGGVTQQIDEACEEIKKTISKLNDVLSAHPDITTEQWMDWYTRQQSVPDPTAGTMAGFMSSSLKSLFGEGERQALAAVWPIDDLRFEHKFFRMLINDPHAKVTKDEDAVVYTGKIYPGIGRQLWHIDRVVLAGADGKEKSLPILSEIPVSRETTHLWVQEESEPFAREVTTNQATVRSWLREFNGLADMRPVAVVVDNPVMISLYETTLPSNRSPRLIVLTPRDLGIAQPCNFEALMKAAHTFGFGLFSSQFSTMYEAIMSLHPYSRAEWELRGNHYADDSHMIFVEQDFVSKIKQPYDHRSEAWMCSPDQRIILALNA